MPAGGKTAGSWVPGQSGNYNGRPKRGASLKDLIELKLDKDKFVQSLIDLALVEGNFNAYREILERLDGKVQEKIEITHGLMDTLPETEETLESYNKESLPDNTPELLPQNAQDNTLLVNDVKPRELLAELVPDNPIRMGEDEDA